jgi:hypothetical protein
VIQNVGSHRGIADVLYHLPDLAEVDLLYSSHALGNGLGRGLFEIVESDMTKEQIRQDYRDLKIGYDTAIYLLRSYHGMTEVEK